MLLAALELSWSRPLGLAALLLPPALLLLARRAPRPPEVVTGAQALWERVAARAPSSARARRAGTPPALWLLAGGLLCAALALAGPRLAPPPAPRTFTVLVDHSPSTTLPWLAADGAAEAGAETRLARALAPARAWLLEHAGPGDRVRWLSPARAPVTTAPGDDPDAAWLAHPDFRAPPPDVGGCDAPGALLVSDRAPSPEPAFLGWFASGGAAVHGPVAADPGGLWSWDGDALARAPEPGAGGRLFIDEGGGALPPPVRDAVLAWAGARGVALDLARAGARLALSTAGRASPGGELARAVVGRDGWRARASYPEFGAPAPRDGLPWEAWLSAPGGAALVWAAPGRVEVALDTLVLEPGDPALFAVSWAELLDRALLPHAGVVALADRAAAGPPSQRAPLMPAPEERGGPARGADGWLAGLSALCALVALALDRR